MPLTREQYSMADLKFRRPNCMYFVVYLVPILFTQEQYSITELTFKRPKLDVLCCHCWGFLLIAIARAGIWNLKEHSLDVLNIATLYLFFFLSIAISSLLIFLVSCPQYKDIYKAKPSLYWQCWYVRGTVYVLCHHKISQCFTLQLKKLFYVNDTKSALVFFFPILLRQE